MNVLEIISGLRKVDVFPKVESGNLKLIGNTGNIPEGLLAIIKEQKNELIHFLTDNKEFTPAELIPVTIKKLHYDLSNAQKRLWVLSQFEGGNQAYNITTARYLKGVLNAGNLEKAFKNAICCHESLRTTFETINDEPKQIIHEDIDFTISFKKLSSSTNQRQDLIEEVKKASNILFDLFKGPLLKINLIEIGAEEHVLIFSIHHIVSDGWSLGILVQEVMQTYKMICLGAAVECTPLDIQYKDYTEWLSQKLAGEYGGKAKGFWKEKSLTELEPIQLPTDFQRPDMNLFEGSIQKFYFEPSFYKQIENLAKNNHTTVFNVYRAVLSLCLHKWSGQDNIAVGTPVAGRSNYQLANQIGLYVNTLPLVSCYKSDLTFSEYLKIISTDSLSCFRYEDYPLDLILEECDIDRSTSRNPLFDVMMVVQNTALGDGTINYRAHHGFTMDELDNYLFDSDQTEKNDVSSKFDLSFNFASEHGNKNYVELEYRTKLFKKSTIQRLYNAFIFVFKQLTQDSTILLNKVKLVDENEKELIINSFNKVIAAHDERSIIDLIIPQLTASSFKTALIVGEKKISYEQLDKSSNHFAAEISKYKTDKIGLFLHRNENIFYALLGIFKTGKAYVPVDVNYPEERIDYILNDAEVTVLLVDETSIHHVPKTFSGTLIQVENISTDTAFNYLSEGNKEQTAYLIYTSGSTGKPKGVDISHRNAIAFLKWCTIEFRDTPYEIAYAVTSYCFDLSVFEMCLPLIQGKTVRIMQSGLEIPDYILLDRQILINTVPSVVRNLINQEIDWKNVVALNMAGEPVPKVFKDQLDYKRIEVRNLYGPSEDTTYSTIYRFADDHLSFIPIGVPVGDTHLYILDSLQQLVSIGVEGEICLSGESVAKGYYNKPELTAEKFIANPFFPERKMYRTGDIGKWTDDGQVVFIGRLDDQVKVRGYRIEPGEIQYRIESLPQVKNAVVIVADINGEKEIIAYYQLIESISEAEIRQQLSMSLPGYMIPGIFMELAEIPMNSNGKVDKRKLPSAQKRITKIIVLPTNMTQEKLLTIWKEALGRSDFGVEHNFFELGGHSLKAMKLKSLVYKKFEKEMTLNELFLFPTIREQSEIIDTKGKKKEIHIKKIEYQAQDYYPLSFAQERLWVLTKFQEASKAYHMPAAFKVNGDLDIELLTQALKMVQDKHESLRTVFKEVNHQPVQIILKAGKMPVTILKQTIRPDENLFLKLSSDWQQAFDLENGPLFNCSVIEQGQEKILSFNMHHIISDGWSIGVLFNDIIKAYAQLKNQEGVNLLPLEIQYKDFTVWQRKEMTNEVLQEQLAFWKNQVFKGGIASLELPYDRFRPETKTYHGSTFKKTFDKKILKGLKGQSSEAGVTLFMNLMAQVSVLLKKLSNQEDITIGTPVSGRDSSQLQSQIGFYINTLPIRNIVNGELSFADYLTSQRSLILPAFDAQYFPFEMLVEALQPKRDLSRSPLFDVMLVLQNFDVLENTSLNFNTGVNFEKLDISPGITKYDLTFSFAEQNDQLVLDLEYNTDLFNESTIQKFVRQLELVLTTTRKSPHILIKDISIIDETDFELITSKADQTHVTYQREETIVSRFKQIVALYPENIALQVGEKNWSYKELDHYSGQLAYVLKNEYHLNDEELVVMYNSRNEHMLINMLAILKAGGVYVPVDPDYPLSRIQYILSDSEARIVLTDGIISEEAAKLMEGQLVIDVTSAYETAPVYEGKISPEQLAYIIYTSGTTGNPKGVQIEHRNVNRLLFNDNDLFDFNEKDSWSLFHSYCFDFSVWEIYGALLKGGRLVMVPKETAQDSVAFFNFLQVQKITILNQTPTAFRTMSLTNNNSFSGTSLAVRYLIFGGEALMPEILSGWHTAFPSCKIINMYGITETTVHVTYKEITEKEIKLNKSNIGIPIPTLSCYILDKEMRLSAIGVIGELCVGGAGVARGYHNKPELTDEKFIRHPLMKSEKLYRSGDYAKILSNGDIEYIGRKDDQVKIRGHRIELTEVEAGIKKLPNVKDTVVLAVKNQQGEMELVAYIIPITTIEEKISWRTALKDILPGYMIPGHYILLTEFPLTSNGKLNKSALPVHMENTMTEFVPARNETDEKIITLWKQILEKEKIGIRDNFFDLGGHSLKATRVISGIQELFGIRIDLANLFISPTIEALSDHVSTLKWIEEKENEVTTNENELVI